MAALQWKKSMIIDQQNLFSDAQAVTASANSTNVIDNLGTSNQVAGAVTNPITCYARVLAAFAGGTSLQISLVSADDIALSVNPVVHFNTPAIPVASLTAGTMAFAAHVPPQKLRKYLGLKYTVVGTMTAGTIIAGLADDVDTAFRSTDFANGYTAL